MADQFTIRNELDNASSAMAERARARRDALLEAERARVKRLIRLAPTLFLDSLTHEILRKIGSQYIFIRHDKRRAKRSDGAVTLKPIQGGLYFDPKEIRVYQLRNGHYVLYSKDRRKSSAAKSPTGQERRKR